jgi:hypothetical protein
MPEDPARGGKDMAMKINGIDGKFIVPNVNNPNYRFTQFEATMRANVNGIEKTVNVRNVVENAWNGVVKRSQQTACNECFKTLPQKKTLAEILAGADLVIHCLEPKEGKNYDSLPYANTAGRDIGLDPTPLFGTDPELITCTLIHELAHVGGASTNPRDPQEQAHAAEKTLLSCSCKQHYNKSVLGSFRIIKPGQLGPRYA